MWSDDIESHRNFIDWVGLEVEGRLRDLDDCPLLEGGDSRWRERHADLEELFALLRTLHQREYERTHEMPNREQAVLKEVRAKLPPADLTVAHLAERPAERERREERLERWRVMTPEEREASAERMQVALQRSRSLGAQVRRLLGRG